MSDARPLNGHVIAITGAGRGVGKAAAAALAARGAHVTLGDLDFGHAERVATAINHGIAREGGGAAIALGLDVRDRASFHRFLEETSNDFGPLDVLVNCAGVAPAGPLLEETEDAARQAFDVNVGGTLMGMKLALPGMVQRQRGHIVNVAAASAGMFPAPERVTHAASTSAVLALTRGARSEFRGRGVCFTTVVPTSSDPDRVARAIVGAVRSRGRTVFVPARVRPVGAALGVLPQAVRSRIYRAIEAKASAPAG